MNPKGIVFGGLLAGVIIALGQMFLNVVILRPPVHPGTGGLWIDGTPVAIAILKNLFLGLGCVLLYTLMRPRLGPGVKTALTAGVLVFLLGTVFPPLGLALTAASPGRLLMIAIVWTAVEIPLATVAGAWVYRERVVAARS